MTGDPEQDYFVDGIVEEITTAISRLPWLFVIARNSSFTYKGRAVDMKQVARELGVRYVLEGSVRKAGNRVRITGQLINTATGAHIWADRFDGALDDIFELQDEVASSVVGAIEPKLRQSEIERATRKPTESLDAHDLYLRALALRDIHTDESMREAIALLKQALAIDSNYVPAKAAIGWSRIYQRSHGRSPMSEAEIAEAVDWAREAVEAGKDDPDALYMAAFTLFYFAGDRAVAAAAVDRALALNPNSAHAWMVRGYVSLPQSAAAIEAFDPAMRLNPFDGLERGFIVGIAVAHLFAGRYEQALDWSLRALREQPTYSAALRTKAIACALLDRIEEARETVRQLLAAQPWNTLARTQPFYARLFGSQKAAAIYVEGLRKQGCRKGDLASSTRSVSPLASADCTHYIDAESRKRLG
jgi:adenylate cyclase